MRVRATPERTCVGCRRPRPKPNLLRIVRTPGGKVVVDETGKIAGRGAYVCREEGCLDAANKGRRLERALRRAVPAEEMEKLRRLVVARG